MVLSAAAVDQLLRLGMTPRAERIDQHVRFVDGTIYDGRPDFLDDSCNQPLGERNPCVKYPAVANAINSYSTMCLGEGKFPSFSSGISEDDTELDKRFGLSEVQSKILDAVLDKIVEQTGLGAVCQQILEAAMAASSCAVFVSIVAGRLQVTHFDAKTCEPEFDPKVPGRVIRLVVTYRYSKKEIDPITHKPVTTVWVYRREIDDKEDVVFRDVQVTTARDFPKPDVAKERYQHTFGFCPVIWYPYLRPAKASADFDGVFIHQNLLGNIDAINQTLSQRHRAALYAGDPQIIETGVEDDDARLPMGSASQSDDLTRDRSGFGQPLYERRAGRMTKRKKGAGTVWRYASPDAKVEILSVKGDALATLESNAVDLIAQIREAMGHVHVDPKDLTGSGDISGKTLAFLFSSQIARCNRIRTDFWRHCLLPLIGMLLRVVLKVQKGLYLAGAEKVRPILAKFESEIEAPATLEGQPAAPASTAWFDPHIKPTWGAYFEASDLDEQAIITTAVTAKDGGLITMETAVAFIRSIFPDIQDVKAYIETLNEQKEQAQQDAMDMLHAAAPTSAAKAPPGSKARPKMTRTPKPGQLVSA